METGNAVARIALFPELGLTAYSYGEELFSPNQRGKKTAHSSPPTEVFWAID